MAGCVQRGVPVCLVNARLSDQSLQQAQRLRWLAQPAYAALAAVWAQSDADGRRLRQIGAPVRAVTGNLKFDARPDPSQLQQALCWRQTLTRPVVLFASSREGEEDLLLDLLQGMDAALRERVQWLIVPRHPQRFATVAACVRARALSVSLRSSWAERPLPATVWVGDSLGEMALYFGLADVALLGGSFAPLGGQNLIEAAACSCPVVMGPHTFNFAEAARQAEQSGAALRVADLAAAVACSMALLQQPQTLAQTRQQALAWSQAHRGAAQRTLQELAPFLAPCLVATDANPNAVPQPGMAQIAP